MWWCESVSYVRLFQSQGPHSHIFMTGGPDNFLGLKFWPKVSFFDLWKMPGFFWVARKKNRGIFCVVKKGIRDFLGMLKIILGRQILKLWIFGYKIWASVVRRDTRSFGTFSWKQKEDSAPYFTIVVSWRTDLCLTALRSIVWWSMHIQIWNNPSLEITRK